MPYSMYRKKYCLYRVKILVKHVAYRQVVRWKRTSDNQIRSGIVITLKPFDQARNTQAQQATLTTQKNNSKTTSIIYLGSDFHPHIATCQEPKTVFCRQ